MAHGGSRPGAGRKPSSLNKRTREIAEKAAASGLTPLEVMLRAMNEHVAASKWDMAAAIAKDAAPYIHPKLASIEHSGPEGGPIHTISDSPMTNDEWEEKYHTPT